MRDLRLGGNGPVISRIGIGCFGMSHAYGATDAQEATATINRALHLGCNFLDTADSYGAGQNEELVARSIAGRRHEVVLATKFGFVWDETGHAIARDGSPRHVSEACNASLRRLQTEVIDLYYLHRLDPTVPIEETVGAMGELVRQGKVRHLGLSEVSASNLRRAHGAHPISALQSEYSLWARHPEQEIIPLCRELGITFVAFAPLGRGAFVESLCAGEIPENDFRRSLPRFQQSHRERNLQLAHRLQGLARAKRCSPAQLSLAWLLSRGQHISAVPGSSKRSHLEENLGAADVLLSPTESQQLDEAFSPSLIEEQRYDDQSLFRPD